MGVALSALVAILCATAALRELARAVAPTFYDPALLQRAIAASRPTEPGDGDDASAACEARLDRVAQRMASLAPTAWECALFAAFLERDPSGRDACVNELLTELDGITERGARVPGACARIALSSGFFFATMNLLGATFPAVGAVDRDSLMSTLAPALNALAFGIAGATFCGAVHARAKAARRRVRAAFDSLVMTLQSCNLSESR